MSRERTIATLKNLRNARENAAHAADIEALDAATDALNAVVDSPMYVTDRRDKIMARLGSAVIGLVVDANMARIAEANAEPIRHELSEARATIETLNTTVAALQRYAKGQGVSLDAYVAKLHAEIDRLRSDLAQAEESAAMSQPGESEFRAEALQEAAEEAVAQQIAAELSDALPPADAPSGHPDIEG